MVWCVSAGEHMWSYKGGFFLLFLLVNLGCLIMIGLWVPLLVNIDGL